MAYEQRTQRRQKVRYNSANDDNLLKYQLIVEGAKVTPTSGTITVYTRGNTTALLAATALTVDGTLLTYALDTTTTASWPIATGYRAELAIVYGGITYTRHFIFDVVKFLLDINTGYDQLVAYDDAIQGMEHNGDEDFSELIESCRDDLQVKLETKILKDEKLIENAILDYSAIAVCAKLYILYRIWRNKGDEERAKEYREEFYSMWNSVLNTIRYDTAQDGDEDSEIGGVQEVRLVT